MSMASALTPGVSPLKNKNAALMNFIVCPQCKAELKKSGDALTCSKCAAAYPVRDGVVCFAPTDEFYDEYAQEHCIYALDPAGLKAAILKAVPFWSYREWRFWQEALPMCDRLLDIGSGRGREMFNRHAKETVGYDVSLACIRDCVNNYEFAAQGSLPGLPFQSRSFDAVVSCHVIGHIAFEDKDELIAEMARVLKPGGRAVHIIETDSDHPMIEAAKKDPAAYQKYFIEQDGHIGLEKVDEVIARFEKQGFKLKLLRTVGAVKPSLQHFRKYFDHPEYRDLPGAAELRRLSEKERKSALANLAYEISMGAFHRGAEQTEGKRSYASFMMASFELDPTAGGK